MLNKIEIIKTNRGRPKARGIVSRLKRLGVVNWRRMT